MTETTWVRAARPMIHNSREHRVTGEIYLIGQTGSPWESHRWNSVRRRKSMQMLSVELRECIDNCVRCYEVCLSTSMGHCLQTGGPHVEAQHVRLMATCAEICRTSATLMLIGTEYHPKLCTICAEVCNACAASCDQVGDMEDSAKACRICAESCHKMAS